MAPTSLHVLFPRDDPSLRELFHHFPTKVWLLVKLILFGLSLILALYAILFGTIYLCTWIYTEGPLVIYWLKSEKWREVVEEWGEKVGRLRKIEGADMMRKWLERWRVGSQADEAVHAAELERLDSTEGEGSVGGETLFEGEGDGDGKWTPGKEDEIELDREDYMNGK